MDTFRNFLSNLFGSYVPVTYEYGGETIIPDGLAGVDFSYVGRVLIFAILLWSLLRLIGGMVCKM